MKEHAVQLAFYSNVFFVMQCKEDEYLLRNERMTVWQGVNIVLHYGVFGRVLNAIIIKIMIALNAGLPYYH